MEENMDFRAIARDPYTWAKNKPKLVTARSVGKTTMVGAMLSVACDLVANHSRRMRGKFVHARKGKYQRRHAYRTSWVDA